MDYHFASLGTTCAATGRKLEPGSVCHSVLVHEDGAWTRRDFSEDAWNGPPQDALGHWRVVVPQPETKPRRLDPDELMRYFEQLTEEANPNRERLRYVLALLLMQKKRLEIESTRDDGRDRYLQLVGTRGEGSFEVRDEHLEEHEIESLRTELESLLTANWS